MKLIYKENESWETQRRYQLFYNHPVPSCICAWKNQATEAQQTKLRSGVMLLMSVMLQNELIWHNINLGFSTAKANPSM